MTVVLFNSQLMAAGTERRKGTCVGVKIMFSHGVYTRWVGSSNNKRVRAERRGGINGRSVLVRQKNC